MDILNQTMSQDNGSRFENWAGKAFVLALVLLPLVVVPLAWFPFAVLKVSVFALLLLVAVACFVGSSYLRGSVAVPRSFLLLAVLALPVVYVISAFLSQNKTLSFFGTGGEVTTVLFIVLCAFVTISASMLLRSRGVLRMALFGVTLSLALVALFQVLNLIFGPTMFGISAFSALSSNLIGKWNDFGLVMGLLATLCIASIDIARSMGRMRIISWVLLVLSLILLAIVNLNTAWQVFAGASIIIGLSTLASRRGMSDPMMPRTRTVPYASLVALVVSVIFIAWGNQINTRITSLVSVSELEVRPSISATFDIGKSTYSQSARTALFGTGPSTFVEQWLLYKPAEVNSSQFWNLDFTGGSGAIPTAFITTGVVGAIVWVAIFLLLVLMLIRAVLRPLSDPLLNSVLMGAGVGALFLFVGTFLYLSGQVTILLMFALVGVALAAERMGRGTEKTFVITGAGMTSTAVSGVILLVLCVVSLGTTGLYLQRFASNFYVGKALAAGSTGDLVLAEKQAGRALSMQNSEENLRLLSNIKLSEAQKIVSDSASTQATQEQAAQFQTAFAGAVGYAQNAITLNPRNYQNWALVAQLFEALIPFKVQGSYDNAKQNYGEAIKRNPRNPGLYLALARTEATGGAEQGFKDAIQQALTLKPNYTEAALLVVQVEVARNNIDGAISAAEVAAVTAPQNAGVWFEVGLLKYTKGDNEGARGALEQALTLVPDYANAKYFLGLTYYRLKNTTGAIALFENLAASNPDNAEVKLILDNLKAGKDPFTNAKPPVTSTPEKRPTAPIKE